MSAGQIQIFWALTVGLLIIALLAWPMWAIFREGQFFLRHARSFELGQFTFKAPPWWQAQKEGHGWSFNRPQTNYGFHVDCKSFESNLSLEKLLADWCEQEKFVFDPDFVQSSLNEFELGKNLRMEGSGTYAQEKRGYVDLLVIRPKDSSQVYFFRYQCSILSGTVEGPFYEKLLQSLALIRPAL